MSLTVATAESGGLLPAHGWVVVGHAADVPLLEGRSVEVAGRRVAIFCLPDGWAAVENTCPHRGGPLGDGIVADGCVTCPLHNHRFSLRDGRRLDGSDGSERVTVYDVREREGRLELRCR